MAGFLTRIERAWHRRNCGDGPAQPGDGRLGVAVITGGTEGIGRALAEVFAEHGHHLLLVARSDAALAQAAEALRARFPSLSIGTVSADLAAPDGCDRVEAALNHHGWFADYLVNNAAAGYGGPFEAQPRSDVAALTDLNVRAPSDLMARFLPGMLARGRGGVLNVASLGGLVPGPYQAMYYASKAHVVSLTEALAHEISGRGVRMAVLAPGPVNTAFHARMGADTAIYTRLPGMIEPERAARIGYANFMAWQTVIVPGVMPMLIAAAARFIPNYLVTPFVGLILKSKRAPDRP